MIQGTLRSGLVWVAEDEFDLHVFNDIFVCGEYDRAFDCLVDKHPEQVVTIVDLGCNVGYFTLYAADRMIRQDRQFDIYSIDASASNIEKMIKRLRAQPTNKLVNGVTIHNALVGMTHGKGPFRENQNHALNRIEAGGALLPYTPVAQLIPDGPIDILKIDVESAEQMLLEGQPELFRRTYTTIIEFHHKNVDVDQCEKMLFNLGFTESYICREAGDVSTRVYYK